VTLPAASDSAPPSTAAVLRIVRNAGGALLVQAGLHARLLRVEWAEAKERLMKMLLATLLGFACLLALLLTLGALLVALSWGTPYRLQALAALTALYALGAAFAWRSFQVQSQLNSTSFAATRVELAADLDLLRGQL
jgi:uncharacterized membrane protein YqjE